MNKAVIPEVNDWVLSYMEGLRCPRAVTCAIMYRYGMVGELQSLELNTRNYIDADTYRRAAAATKLLSKLPLEAPELNPVKAALDTWFAAEKQCYISNKRFNELLDFGTLNGEPCPRGVEFLQKLRKNVIRLIGDRPPVEIQGVFGPGATMSDKSVRTSVPHKMSTTPTLTPSAWVHLRAWMASRWAAACAARGDCMMEVRGNVYFQVPKNAKTMRSCAKEPSLNAFYQRAYGEILARRLERAGYSFEHAKEIHVQVARLASITGLFATLDLRSASDTVCAALVRAAFPPAWYEVLDSLRAHYTRIDEPIVERQQWHRLEKFSSMGNGFTFEVEMTLFTAIILTECPGLQPGRTMWVWGDDIIVPTHLAQRVESALTFCGFTINTEKSFVDGPFRESCGGDFWDGEAVRPYYLKEIPDEPQKYIATANGIRYIMQTDPRPNGLGADLRRTWFRVLDHLPAHIRACRGPESLGDLVIHDSEERWKTRSRSSIRYVQVYRPVRFPTVSFDRFDPDVQYGAALYGVRLSSVGTPQTRSGAASTYPRWYYLPGVDRRTAPLRGDPLAYKVGWTPYS